MMRLLKMVGPLARGMIGLIFAVTALAAAELPAPRAVGLSLDTNVVLQGSSTNLFRVNSNLVQQAVGVPHVPYVLHGETNLMMPYGLKLTAGSGVTLATNGQDLTITAGSGSVTHTTGDLTVNTPLLGAGGDDLKSVSVGDFKIALDLESGQDIQAWDADLDDLADGSLSGAKVGSGIDAANITTGALPAARLVAVLTNTFLLHGETNALTTNGLKLTAGANITLTTNGQNLEIAGAAGSGSGTVTSVGVSVPDVLTVSGSPVTDSGTIAIGLAEQSPNQVWAGPAAGAGTEYPSFRALSTNDMPSGVTLDHEWNTALEIYSALGVADKTGSGKMVFDQGAVLGFPTIDNFVNANHSHQGGSSGGYLSTDAIYSGTLNAARLPLGVTRAGAMIIVDAVNGDDGTGTRGRSDLPFANVGAAVVVLQSGDTLIIRPGTYAVTRPGIPVNSSQYAYHTTANYLVKNMQNVLILGHGAVIASSGLGNVWSITDCTNVTMMGLTMRGPGRNPIIAAQICGEVSLWGTNSNVRFVGVGFEDFPNHGILVSQAEKTSYNSLVDGCWFVRGGTTNHTALGTDGAGVASLGPGLRVIGCTFDQVTRGVEIEGSGAIPKGPAVLSGFTMRNMINQGVILLETSGIGTNLNDITIGPGTISFDRSSVPTAGQYGISASGGRNISVQNVTVYNANNTGFAFGTSHADLRRSGFSGCTAVSCGVSFGITDAGNRGIFDNYVEQCNAVASTTAQGGIVVAGSATRVVGNLVSDSAGYGIYVIPNGAGTAGTTNVYVASNLIRTPGFHAIGIAANSVDTYVLGNNLEYAASKISDAGTGTLVNQLETLGTTENPDIDDALDALDLSITSVANALGDSISALVTDPQTWSAQQSFDAAHNNKPETASQTNYTGTTFSLDCDGPERVEWEITGDATLSLANVPTAGNRIGIRFQVNATNSQLTNCVFVLDEVIVQGTKRAAAVIKAGEFLTTWLDWNGTNFVADWRGDQSDPGPIELGFTGVTTGIAPGGKDVLGDWSTTQTTNHFPDLASGTVFRFPNTLNPYLGAPASRITSSESNSLVITRRIEMLPASEERIIGIDTNYYALQGINQWTTNPAGVSFCATLINWGPDSSNNIVVSTLSTNAAAAGGGSAGTDYTDDMVEYWGLQDPSGNLTGENGYHLTALGGSYTYRAAGLVEAYSITNTGDSSLVATNPSPALQFDGTASFSVAGWAHLANAATDFRYVVTRYDNGTGDRVFGLLTSSGIWSVIYATNTSGAYTWSTGIAAVTGSNYVALVYDGTVPEIKVTVNGSSFASLTLNAPLVDEPVAFTLGGRLDSGVASNSRTAGYEQWALWDAAKTLTHFQDLYNSGSGKPRSEWTP